ncbi:hypothetical protein BD779DRAFT_543980 [Infundibulicybe gibba]|nr:hypothetical protein BD779DRAFT_543980 [Infundibulicybe gibba]
MSTTPPAKSRWSRRIGTAVRRVSSGLTPRPAAPPVDSSDFGSLKKTNIHVSPPLPPPHPPETSAPIEFPTREGPFINDTGYARPRLTDSSTSLGSGTFTDELDDLPQPVNIEPPANCSPSSSASQIFATPSPLVAETPMVPSQVTGPLECKTEFGPRPAAEPEAECGPVRDREFLCRPVREAFAPGSVREVEREAVHEPVMKGHGPPCLTRGNTISDTTPSTPVDEYIPLALNSPTAGPGEADSQSIEHKHSSSSLKQFTTAPANLSLPSSTNQHSVIPSPIAESPAHEAAASQEDHAPIGLSSLAQGTVVRNAASANEYTPPPLLDSSAVGPRGFTDEPDDLPQPLAAVGPARSHPPSIHERESAAEGAQADTTEPQPQAAAPQVEAPTPQTEPPAPQAEASALQVVAPAPQADLLQPMAFIGPARPSPSSTHEESQVAAPNAPNKPTTPQAEPRMRSNPEVWGDAVPLLQTPERKAGEVIIPNNGDASDQSRAPSIHVPHEDPFVDPSHPSEPDPPILSIYEPVGGPLREEVPVTMMPIPASAQSVYGFGAGETPANQTHPGPPESVVYQQPPAYPDYGYVAMPPSEGMMPSHLLYPPGQGLSRRRVRPSQEPEQEKVGSGDGRTRVGWVVPFSRDSRTSDAYQRNPGETPDRAYNTTHGFETCDTPSLISPPSPSSGSSGYGCPTIPCLWMG